MALVNEESCIGCWDCIPYCPVDAFKKSIDETVVYIDQDICTNCYVCIRNDVCPVDAIAEPVYDNFIEEFQHIISDPTVTTEGTGVPGRGTEEAKTNDVTGRYKKDEFGICIDMGRPGIGCKLKDVEKVAMAVAKAGVELEGPDTTPLAMVMEDLKTGKLRDDVLDINVLSIIVEGKCAINRFPDVIDALKEIEDDIDTVFSLGVVARVDENGDSVLFDMLNELNIPRPQRGKVNVGLGKPLVNN